MSAFAPGEVLFTTTHEIDRARLVRYAGASRDFNPIHWSDHVAEGVGLPGVIAHGMLTLGLASAALSDWVGDPGRVRDVGARFSRQVPVPVDGSVTLEVTGTVREVLDDGGLRVDLSVTFEGRTVLARAQAVLAPLADEPTPTKATA